jgi:predicted nucleotidyltransferase
MVTKSAELEHPAPAPLVGTSEAAELFGVRPSNFLRDWASRPDFPSPAANLRRGRLWDRRALELYRARRRPRRSVNNRSLDLSVRARRWLPVAKRRIVRGFRPERIVLFGSQARGEADEDADLDLLVVMPDGTDVAQTGRAIRAALADLGIGKDVFVTTPSRIARYGHLVGSILEPALREGVTVYARG